MALKDKVKEWMNNNDIGGDNPWFDKDNTYYNLTVNQIIAVSKYLNSCDGGTVRAGENTLPIQRVSIFVLRLLFSLIFNLIFLRLNMNANV